MRPINKKCVILSAEQDICTDKTNRHNSQLLENQFKYNGLNYKHLIGSYKGKLEASFLVEYDSQNERRLINSLAGKFNQESVLLLDEDRNAVLYNESENGLTQIPLGKLKPITPRQAEKLDAWSYCPINDQYYGVL